MNISTTPTISSFTKSLRCKKGLVGYFLDLIISLSLVLFALTLRLQIAPPEVGLQYITFFPAVTIAALVSGFRAGFFAILLSILVSTYFFVPPYQGFSIGAFQKSLWSNLIFFFDGFIVAFSIEKMHRYAEQTRVQLKRTQKILHRFHDLFEHLPAAYQLLDNNGNFISVNDQFCSLVGYSREELLNLSFRDILEKTEQERFEHFLHDITCHEAIARKIELVKKDKTIIIVEISISIQTEDDGTKAYCIVHDVTDLVRAEQTMREAHQVAEEANRSKSEFIANMSHEIRTPMNAILGLLQLTLESDLSEMQRNYLGKIQRSSYTLLGILNDVLDLSKIEAGKVEIEMVEFDPARLLQEITELFMPKAEEKGLEILLDIESQIPMTILSDSLRLKQIVSNLLGNALKFTDFGEIQIKLRLLHKVEENLLLEIEVCDTGIGIAQENLATIFETFKQGDTTITRKFGGTGLGLTISKQLVELIGGDISVSSKVGQGSCFSFTLPCVVGKPYDWTADTYHLRDLRVLIVDDHEMTVLVLQRILESWGIAFDTAFSGIEALEKIRAAHETCEAFDLLLLDWLMPELDGLGVIKELERLEMITSLTIVMITAYKQDKLLTSAKKQRVRFDAILHKPVTPSVLLNTIVHAHQNGQKNNSLHIEKVTANCYERAKILENVRVLLVEDNEINQEVAALFLRKAGIDVTIASDGQEAVEWALQHDFDAVLMDIQMPVMDGYEATRIIRKLPAKQNLPIIAMTAAALQHDRDLCLAAGMNDHVGKPVSPDALIDVLIKWINPQSPPQSIPAFTIPQISASKKLTEQLTHFQLGDVLTMLSGDEKKLASLLHSFREKFQYADAEIHAFLDKNEIVEAERYLHTLKGSSGNLGVTPLHKASSALDDELKQGFYQPQTLENWHACFEECMNLIAKLPL